ncbi:hypothetical protein SERLA73DRAFT_78863 [Serpula lacrymans var. lacrymans S7.3]|uniref:Non-classical export protein 1 n=2 Tax=Serpula lacrymans var. lacrymans TaxID=341189 RepID=F8QEJ9_SERL3|nr:uncharacterized protein SERLADRAFT_443974 [Serpula lacrymans var. lacrymans S7.9]EGN93255.1 hypothetical protein SERLA73DRAFT_78863 [Serpula lacrymans var. lacrymans S7.3]EGO18639.1 hypothetical protein SERLADRAFT_443974 [Serpula lacrymans var. lacrymans S7.9]
MAYPVIVSRAVDPILGVFTGCLAYYLYETNPRNTLPSDRRLAPLVQWKWATWQAKRLEKLHNE